MSDRRVACPRGKMSVSPALSGDAADQILPSWIGACGGSIESDAPGTTRKDWAIPVPRSKKSLVEMPIGMSESFKCVDTGRVETKRGSTARLEWRCRRSDGS